MGYVRTIVAQRAFSEAIFHIHTRQQGSSTTALCAALASPCFSQTRPSPATSRNIEPCNCQVELSFSSSTLGRAQTICFAWVALPEQKSFCLLWALGQNVCREELWGLWGHTKGQRSQLATAPGVLARCHTRPLPILPGASERVESVLGLQGSQRQTSHSGSFTDKPSFGQDTVQACSERTTRDFK